jgi:hypothetical protein
VLEDVLVREISAGFREGHQAGADRFKAPYGQLSPECIPHDLGPGHSELSADVVELALKIGLESYRDAGHVAR